MEEKRRRACRPSELPAFQLPNSKISASTDKTARGREQIRHGSSLRQHNATHTFDSQNIMEAPAAAAPAPAAGDLIREGDYVVVDEHGDKKSLVVIKANG